MCRQPDGRWRLPGPGARCRLCGMRPAPATREYIPAAADVIGLTWRRSQRSPERPAEAGTWTPLRFGGSGSWRAMQGFDLEHVALQNAQGAQFNSTGRNKHPRKRLGRCRALEAWPADVAKLLQAAWCAAPRRHRARRAREAAPHRTRPLQQSHVRPCTGPRRARLRAARGGKRRTPARPRTPRAGSARGLAAPWRRLRPRVGMRPRTIPRVWLMADTRLCGREPRSLRCAPGCRRERPIHARTGIVGARGVVVEAPRRARPRRTCAVMAPSAAPVPSLTSNLSWFSARVAPSAVAVPTASAETAVTVAAARGAARAALRGCARARGAARDDMDTELAAGAAMNAGRGGARTRSSSPPAPV